MLKDLIFLNKMRVQANTFCFEEIKKKELVDVLMKEEVHSRQSSRIKWIKEGDTRRRTSIV